MSGFCEPTKTLNKVLYTPRLIKFETRLYSSRMRSARMLTVSPSMLCAGGAAPGWGRCQLPWEVPAPRGGSQHTLRQTPPLWTESQTPVKTLPCPNFVAGGKNRQCYLIGSATCIYLRQSSEKRGMFIKKVVNWVVFHKGTNI